MQQQQKTILNRVISNIFKEGLLGQFNLIQILRRSTDNQPLFYIFTVSFSTSQFIKSAVS